MFKNVIWSKTLQINAIRCLIAGLIWGIIFLFSEDASSVQEKILMFSVMPLIFLLILFPFNLLILGLSKIGIPYIVIIYYILTLLFVLADPIMFILHRVKENLVPVEKYNFINFNAAILVLLPEEATT